MDFIILSLFSVLINSVSSETFYIVTSPKSHCPQEFRGEPCLTLKQYASHSSKIPNVTLIMESGSHILQETRFQFGSYAARGYSFIMMAQSTRTVTTSSITISYVQYAKISGITFTGTNAYIMISDAQVVFVNDCTFQGTGFHLSDVNNITISRCNFSDYSSHRSTYYYQRGALSINAYSSTVVMIAQCNFNNNERAIEIQVYRYYGYYGNEKQSLYITASIFRNNTLGGAVYFTGDRASILVYQSIFVSNTASQSGGAIHLDVKHLNCSITESTFIQNSASSCGALTIVKYNDNSIIKIIDSIFNYNSAESISNSGGGAVCIMNTTALISKSTFVGNTAAGFGGAMVSHNSTVVINDTTFHNNTAGLDGGALITYIHPSNYTITQSTFIHNQAGDDGGAIFVGHRGSYVRLEMCTFTSNHAIDRGGAIAIFGSTIEITETSIDNNRAALGDTFSLCNSDVMTSIYGYRDNCSYDGPSTSHFNVTSASKNQTFTNITLNIGKFCIERQQSQNTKRELNKVSTAAYASITISVTIVIAFLLYLLIEKLVQSKIRCMKASTVLSATQLPSEPLYDEATLQHDNAEAIEMKPNVLYERCEPQSQAQSQEITSS